MVNTIPEGFGERPTFIVPRSTFVVMVIIFFSDREGAKGAKFSLTFYVPFTRTIRDEIVL